MINFILEISKEDILTLSSAILNEPIVECEKRKDKDSLDYLFGTPSSHPKFLESYEHPDETDIMIEDGPPCLSCPGIEGYNREHSFLAFEGMEHCSMCATELYTACCYHPKFFAEHPSKNIKYYYHGKAPALCMDCYRQSSVRKFFSILRRSTKLK